MCNRPSSNPERYRQWACLVVVVLGLTMVWGVAHLVSYAGRTIGSPPLPWQGGKQITEEQIAK